MHARYQFDWLAANEKRRQRQKMGMRMMMMVVMGTIVSHTGPLFRLGHFRGHKGGTETGAKISNRI